MKKSNIIAGLHIGTSTIKIVAAQQAADQMTQIIGACSSSCRGMKKDAVIDMEEVAKSIISSLETAERITGVPIDRAYIDIGGMQIKAEESKGVVAVSRADGEVSADDVSRAINTAQTISIPANREIVYVCPKSFSVDDQKHIKDPVGMNGVRLEANTMIVTASTPAIKNLTKCIVQAGVEIIGTIPAPFAAAKSVLTKRQKELGCAVINMGAGATSLIVYENGELMHIAALPVGASHITNDIAIGLRTSIDIAEKIKMEFGSALPAEIHRRDQIDLSKIDSAEEGIFSRRKVAEIIEARMQEIFYLSDKELKKSGHRRLLPAGIILTGGGSKIPGAADLAKEILRLPAQIGFPQDIGGLIDKVDDPSFAIPLGLAMFAAEEMEKTKKWAWAEKIPSLGLLINKAKQWIKAFMP